MNDLSSVVLSTIFAISSLISPIPMILSSMRLHDDLWITEGKTSGTQTTLHVTTSRLIASLQPSDSVVALASQASLASFQVPFQSSSYGPKTHAAPSRKKYFVESMFKLIHCGRHMIHAICISIILRTYLQNQVKNSQHYVTVFFGGVYVTMSMSTNTPWKSRGFPSSCPACPARCLADWILNQVVIDVQFHNSWSVVMLLLMIS